MTKRYSTFVDYLKAEYAGPFCATDIVIRHDPAIQDKDITIPWNSSIVLIERKEFPFGPAWPGGMAESMTLAKNAIKEAKEETNLLAVLDSVYQPLCVLSEVDQDPRAHIASITYSACGYGELKAGDDAKRAHLVSLTTLESLAKDERNWAMPHHRKIAIFYLNEVQKHVSN